MIFVKPKRGNVILAKKKKDQEAKLLLWHISIKERKCKISAFHKLPFEVER